MQNGYEEIEFIGMYWKITGADCRRISEGARIGF